MASIGAKRADGKYRARYRDESGREHARHFTRKVDAQRWLDEQTAALVSGMHVSPRTARTTVEQWCATWLEGYADPAPVDGSPGRHPRPADCEGVRADAAG